MSQTACGLYGSALGVHVLRLPNRVYVQLPIRHNQPEHWGLKLELMYQERPCDVSAFIVCY